MNLPQQDRDLGQGGGRTLRRDARWRAAYGARNRDELEALYAEWAEDYDEDHRKIGFIGHELAAEALVRHLEDPSRASVLDVGAGTGAAGLALAARGVQHLTGLDLSAPMLEVAASKGVYERLLRADLGEPIDELSDDRFDAAILVGVFSYGQAPAHAIDEVIRVVRLQGLIVLTLREDFEIDDPMGVARALNAAVAAGQIELVERSPRAPYLPKKDPTAFFTVLTFRVCEGPSDRPTQAFQEAVRAAFSRNTSVKVIDHEHIWDSWGSRLYERYIARQEYYLTECEEEILRRHAPEIAGSTRCFVELGCGSARKIGWLLEAALRIADRVEYLPIDVSRGALEGTVADIDARFGSRVDCRPALGTFAETLGALESKTPKIIAFFGGSAGNLRTLEECLALLESLRRRMSTGDRLLIGFDLHKSEEVLLSAYNAGRENRSFFLHMVRRINRLLGASFDLSAFQLASTYDPEPPYRGIETRCVNLKVATRIAQRSRIEALDLEVALEPNDAVQVGVSRKFKADDILQLGALAGLTTRALWLDQRQWFAIADYELGSSRL